MLSAVTFESVKVNVRSNVSVTVRGPHPTGEGTSTGAGAGIAPSILFSMCAFPLAMFVSHCVALLNDVIVWSHSSYPIADIPPLRRSS